MGNCEFKTKCNIYKIFESHDALSVLKLIYCEGDFFKCERYKRMKVSEAIPENLLPDGSFLE